MNPLAKMDVKYLPGVGPKRAELLESELGISTYFDLLYYFPFRYVDRSRIYSISEIDSDSAYIQIKGRFLNFVEQGEGRKKRLTALFADGTGIVEVVWFNSMRTMANTLRTGEDYIIFGKPTMFNGKWSFSHPEIDKYYPEMPVKGVIGVYNITEKLRNRGITTRFIQKLIVKVLQTIKGVDETLTEELIRRNKLMGLHEALVNIHTPQSLHDLERAKLRLKFDELFYLQLSILRYTSLRSLNLSGFRFAKVGEYFNNFYFNHLPFPLTGAQKKVIKEIRQSMGTGKQMNRLLQGDVGSGKTLVAFMTMLIACDNGYQACMMAPTEILATQHFESIGEMARPLGLKVELLKGSTPKKKREEIHKALQDGSLNILIGTHAVIEDNVQFANLGMVVIDEQHRFGVAQRAKMWKKNLTPPHVLVMTATPIPRTLAMTVYGDLDVSVIDELPPGRKPVQTVLRYENRRDIVNRFIGDKLREGRQIYVVFPLIHENKKLELKNVEDGYEYIRENFPSYPAALVHGQMKTQEKEYQMKRFVEGEARIMVATTVIEVGVNVPNASVMVIENAERFGLSQLHQLRGRVGRGADQSHCILMSHPKMSATTRKRLELMTETSDGFLIAEADLKMRGPGDMEGTQQSGIAFDLKISNLATDGQILQLARDVAKEVIESDPILSKPENALLVKNLNEMNGHTINWSLIS